MFCLLANVGTEQAYIPIEKIIRTSKQSASTSWQCNTTGNHHQPATYGDLCLNRKTDKVFLPVTLKVPWPITYDITPWRHMTWQNHICNIMTLTYDLDFPTHTRYCHGTNSCVCTSICSSVLTNRRTHVNTSRRDQFYSPQPLAWEEMK